MTTIPPSIAHTCSISTIKHGGYTQQTYIFHPTCTIYRSTMTKHIEYTVENSSNWALTHIDNQTCTLSESTMVEYTRYMIENSSHMFYIHKKTCGQTELIHIQVPAIMATQSQYPRSYVHIELTSNGQSRPKANTKISIHILTYTQVLESFVMTSFIPKIL